VNPKTNKDRLPGLGRFGRALFGTLIGLSGSLALSLQFLGYSAYSPVDRPFLLGVLALSIAFLCYHALSYIEIILKPPSDLVRLSILVPASLAAAILTWSVSGGSLLLLSVNLVSSAALLIGLVAPSAPFLQAANQSKRLNRLIVAWLVASSAGLISVGFLSITYSRPFEIALLTILSQLTLGMIAYYLLGRLRRSAQTKPADLWAVLLVFAWVFVFLAGVFLTGLQFPSLFDGGVLLLEGRQIVIFAITSLLSLPWLAWCQQSLAQSGTIRALRQTGLVGFVDENAPGALLAGCFLLLYFLVGTVLNQERFDVDDIFFDADGFIWRYRLTTDQWRDYYWRAVHPLALLILRPSIALIGTVLRGDLHTAAILAVAGGGAACVFLAWMFARRALQNAASSLLVASLLGASASHLIFGSMVETYIFLAAAALLFFVLLQRGKYTLWALAPVGLMTMGITLTNFAQALIAMACVKPDFKLIARFVIIVLALLIPLSLLNNIVYPDSNPLFFIPSSYRAERRNFWPVNADRVRAIAESFALFNIVAPEPIISYHDIPFSQFRFHRAESGQLAEYRTPLQLATAWFWLLLLATAAISSPRILKSPNLRFALAFLSCVALNIALHVRYGKELFLYSPNWTYALVLFLSLAWEKLLPRPWFRMLFLIFLFLLMINNLFLLRTLMTVSAPYFR